MLVLVLLMGGLSFPLSLLAQEESTMIDYEAASMQFDRRLGDDVQRLIDEVVFRHEDTRMYCDSAYLYTEDNKLRAFSNVFIHVSDTVSIYGDRLFYDGNTRIAELTGNVRMVDPSMTLYTDFLVYDLDQHTANYVDGGRIVDGENELTSLWGYYFSDRKEFFFREEVVLVNPEYTMTSDTLMYNTHTEVVFFHGPTTIISDENTIFCRNGWYDTRLDLARFSKDAFLTNREQSLTGDSLFYDRNQSYGEATGNVMLRDSVENIFVTGQFAEHFEQGGLSVVTRDAVLTLVAENDSLFMHADTIKSVFIEATDERFLFAYHRARFYSRDLQGLSDSIAYHVNDSVIYMFHEPVLWSENRQLTANTIEVKTDGRELMSVALNDAAFIISREDDVGFNQMKGRSMLGHFQDNELIRVDVDGNAETVFYIMDEDGSLVGIDKAVASHVFIFLEGPEITGIQFVRQSEAVLYPPDELSLEERLLHNFQWMDSRRPIDKNDIFAWR